jgi:hypothetical protein
MRPESAKTVSGVIESLVVSIVGSPMAEGEVIAFKKKIKEIKLGT